MGHETHLVPKDNEPEGFRTSVIRGIFIVVLNVLILAELSWAIYRGHGAGDHMAWTFLKTFVPLALATFIGGRLLLGRIS